jgi:predicted nicotinamide N-methyase
MKIDTFERMPEFITTDVRVNRPIDVSYRIDADFMTKRHEAMLPPKLVKSANILDLGCAVGASGAWALDHGAAYYVGLELQPKMVTDARENFSKYFEKYRWDILQTSVEDFIIDTTLKFDIIILSGVIYGIIDYYGLLKRLTEMATTCIVIESMHPWKVIDRFGNMTDMSQWATQINLPIVQYTEKIRHSHEDGTKSYEYDGVRISIGAFEQIFGHLNWEVSLDANEILGKTIPDVYDVETVINQDPLNPGNAHLVNTASGPRFVIQAFPEIQNSKNKKYDFLSMLTSNIANRFKEWKK